MRFKWTRNLYSLRLSSSRPSCLEIIAEISPDTANMNVTVPASKESEDAPFTDKKRKAPAKAKGKPAKKKALSDSDEASSEEDEDEELLSSADDSDEPKAKGGRCLFNHTTITTCKGMRGCHVYKLSPMYLTCDL